MINTRRDLGERPVRPTWARALVAPAAPRPSLPPRVELSMRLGVWLFMPLKIERVRAIPRLRATDSGRRATRIGGRSRINRRRVAGFTTGRRSLGIGWIRIRGTGRFELGWDGRFLGRWIRGGGRFDLGRDRYVVGIRLRGARRFDLRRDRHVVDTSVVRAGKRRRAGNRIRRRFREGAGRCNGVAWVSDHHHLRIGCSRIHGAHFRRRRFDRKAGWTQLPFEKLRGVSWIPNTAHGEPQRILGYTFLSLLRVPTEQLLLNPSSDVVEESRCFKKTTSETSS